MVKKIIILFLLCLPFVAKAQYPAPTSVLPFVSMQGFYKVSGGDTSAYLKAANGLYFPLGRKTYKLDRNFHLVGDSLHLSGTIRIDSNILLGIKTIPAWDSGYRILNMAGNVGVRSQIGGHNLALFTNLYNTDGSNTWHYAANGFGSFLYLDQGGGLNLYSAASGTAGGTVSLTTPIFSVTRNGATLTTMRDTSSIDSVVGYHNGELMKVPFSGGGGGGAFLPLDFPSDQTVNQHGHIFNLIASNSFGGAKVYVDSTQFDAAVLDVGGDYGSDIYLDTLSSSLQTQGHTRVTAVVLDTINVLVYHKNNLTGDRFEFDATEEAAGFGRSNAGVTTLVHVNTAFPGIMVTDNFAHKGLREDSTSIDENNYTDYNYVTKRNADSAYVHAITGGYLPLTFAGNNTVDLGTHILYLSTTSGAGTKFFSDGSVILGAASGQSALPYALLIANTPGFGSGMFLAGTFNIDNSGVANTVTASPLDNSSKVATTAYVDAAVTAGSSDTTTNAVTFNNGGSGAASGTTFNGSAARTISYNTIGAQVAGTYLTPTSTNTVTNKDLTSGTNTFPTFNQNTTGSAATLTTPRAINGVNFDGSAAITVTAAAGTLTGTTLNSSVVTSSLTSVGALVSGSIPYSLVTGGPTGLPPTGTAGGELAGTYPNPTVLNSAVIAKVLTGYSSGAGSVASTDNILQAFQKINGNVAVNTTNIATNTTNISSNTTSIAAKANSLVPTAVKTANYTAVVNDFIPVNTTSGNITITLPTTPADKSLIGIKHVVRGGTNTITLTAGGSDVFNVAGGSNTGTITLLNQGTTLQYNASGAIWYSLSTDLALSQLDSRYAASGSGFSNPMTTTGDIIYSSSGTTAARLAIGGANTVLHGGTTPSYSSVANADLANSTISGVALGGSLAALTATNSTLTFSGSYDGSTARTVGLNLATANTWTGLQTFQAGITTSGNITAAKWAQTSPTALNGINIKQLAATYTDNSGSGTTTFMAVNNIGIPTVAASSSSTFTNGVTLYIEGAPANGTNVTITNPYSIYVNNGASYFGGTLTTGNNITSNAAISALSGVIQGHHIYSPQQALGGFVLSSASGSKFGYMQNTASDVWSLGYGANTTGSALITNIALSWDGSNNVTIVNALKLTSAQTSVGGSTSGTAVFSEPEQGTSRKTVIIKLAALVGTASYTFPTAFTTTPSVMGTDDVAAAVVTSKSTTAVTVTGSTSTGTLTLIGY